MDKQADGSYKKSFAAFYGRGYIHVKSAVGSGDSTIWQWQVYIGDCQNLADPETPHYRGHHADPESAFRDAETWMGDYFIHMKGEEIGMPPIYGGVGMATETRSAIMK